jgi:hypothetical protein
MGNALPRPFQRTPNAWTPQRCNATVKLQPPGPPARHGDKEGTVTLCRAACWELTESPVAERESGCARAHTVEFEKQQQEAILTGKISDGEFPST